MFAKTLEGVPRNRCQAVGCGLDARRDHPTCRDHAALIEREEGRLWGRRLPEGWWISIAGLLVLIIGGALLATSCTGCAVAGRGERPNDDPDPVAADAAASGWPAPTEDCPPSDPLDAARSEFQRALIVRQPDDYALEEPDVVKLARVAQACGDSVYADFLELMEQAQTNGVLTGMFYEAVRPLRWIPTNGAPGGFVLSNFLILNHVPPHPVRLGMWWEDLTEERREELRVGYVEAEQQPDRPAMDGRE